MTKTYNELTFTDDFMFCKILQNNEELTKQLVEMILNVKINRVERIESQHSIEDGFDSRGIRLDVYLEDDDQNVYDIEMQTYFEGDLVMRTRYYHSLIAVDNLNKGASYNDIKHSYVIFICNFDPFRIGSLKYTARTRFDEHPSEVIDDGAVSVFLNCACDSDELGDEIRDFCRYVRENLPSKGLTQALENDILMAKNHKRWRREYMTLYEHEEIARKEGRAEGRAEIVKKIAPELMALGLSIEDACSKLGITVEEYDCIKTMNK